MKYKIDFNVLKPEIPFPGISHKYLDQDNIRVRLVEYSGTMEPHLCEKGHYGIILEGVMDIDFGSKVIRYEKGDGVFIPSGSEHKHKAIVISESTKALFIEILDPRE